MLIEAINGSRILAIISRSRSGYSKAMLYVKKAYGDSVARKTARALSGRLKDCVESSCLNGIVNMRSDVLAVDDSVLIGYGKRIYDWAERRVRRYVVTSKIAAVAKAARDRAHIDTARSLGLVILTAVITNIIFSLLSAKDSGPLSWFMRVVFFVVGALLVSCKATLSELKKSSLWCKT